jgi:hypothetical protein
MLAVVELNVHTGRIAAVSDRGRVGRWRGAANTVKFDFQCRLREGLSSVPIILESAVEQGFVGNPGVPGKASFAVNGYSLNKNDNAAGCVVIFHKFLLR